MFLDSSDETLDEIQKIIKSPTAASGYRVRGITCPWGVSFKPQVLQIPTCSRVGGMGLYQAYIDRCTIIVSDHSRACPMHARHMFPRDVCFSSQVYACTS